MKLLILDDQKNARKVLRRMLGTIPNIEVVEASSLEEARRMVQTQAPDLMLVDVRLSDSASDPGPDSCPELLLPISVGLHQRTPPQGEPHALSEPLKPRWGLASLVGSSEKMERVRRLVQRVADADAPLLIRGDTGTGKELVARAIHGCSRRAARPFIAVNCSALPGTLIESMIFGHYKGAFTGADRRVRGQLELAGEGTLLLDEIAEMPVQLQAKLLRVLEDRKFRPLGSEVEKPLRARILAATHVDLESHIAQGKFREDLYYRLNVVSVQLPSLSEHVEDIDELLAAFNGDLSQPLRFTEEAIAWLKQRNWPGNVRELRNAVERLALLNQSKQVGVPELEELLGGAPLRSGSEIAKMARALLAFPSKVGSKLDLIERSVLSQAIQACNGNKSAAARLIGIDRKALDRRLSRFSNAPPASSDLPPAPSGRSARDDS